MARAAAADERDGVGVGVSLVDCFVGEVEGQRGVGQGEGLEGGLDEVGGVVYEVFCWEGVVGGQ